MLPMYSDGRMICTLTSSPGLTLSGPTSAMFEKPAEGFDNFAPENSTPLFGYLASPRAERISAQLFIVWGKQVRLVGRPDTRATFDSATPWSLDNLHEHLGPYFEKLEPVTDGFIVPAS